jgi:hypothetical protein
MRKIEVKLNLPQFDGHFEKWAKIGVKSWGDDGVRSCISTFCQHSGQRQVSDLTIDLFPSLRLCLPMARKPRIVAGQRLVSDLNIDIQIRYGTLVLRREISANAGQMSIS